MKTLTVLLSFTLAGIGVLPIDFVTSALPGRANTMLPLGQSQALISNTKWQGTSFPVEIFQGYTSLFGYRRSIVGGPGKEFHLGLDMRAPKGSYVRSWKTGVVLQVLQDEVCGTSIKIQSGDWIHQYCHLEGTVEVRSGRRYFVDRAGGLQFQEQQSVLAGTRIGRVGMTGRTTGPHLHWGLMYRGQWVDPGVVLRAMYSQQAGRQAAVGGMP